MTTIARMTALRWTKQWPSCLPEGQAEVSIGTRPVGMVFAPAGQMLQFDRCSPLCPLSIGNLLVNDPLGVGECLAVGGDPPGGS